MAPRVEGGAGRFYLRCRDRHEGQRAVSRHRVPPRHLHGSQPLQGTSQGSFDTWEMVDSGRRYCTVTLWSPNIVKIRLILNFLKHMSTIPVAGLRKKGVYIDCWSMGLPE